MERGWREESKLKGQWLLAASAVLGTNRLHKLKTTRCRMTNSNKLTRRSRKSYFLIKHFEIKKITGINITATFITRAIQAIQLCF